MKVCIIGLGEVGLPTAKYVQTKEFETWGYDKDQTVVKRAIENGFQNATSEWLKIPPADVYVICVSTRVLGTLPDHSSVFDVCEKSSRYLNMFPWSQSRAQLFLVRRKEFGKTFSKNELI